MMQGFFREDTIYVRTRPDRASAGACALELGCLALDVRHTPAGYAKGEDCSARRQASRVAECASVKRAAGGGQLQPPDGTTHAFLCGRARSARRGRDGSYQYRPWLDLRRPA